MWLCRGPCEIISASHSAFSLNCSHGRSHACMTLDSSLQELGRRPGCHSGTCNIHIEWKKTHSGRAVSWVLSGVLPKNIPGDSLSDSSEESGAEGNQRGHRLGRGICAVGAVGIGKLRSCFWCFSVYGKMRESGFMKRIIWGELAWWSSG